MTRSRFYLVVASNDGTIRIMHTMKASTKKTAEVQLAVEVRESMKRGRYGTPSQAKALRGGYKIVDPTADELHSMKDSTEEVGAELLEKKPAKREHNVGVKPITQNQYIVLMKVRDIPAEKRTPNQVNIYNLFMPRFETAGVVKEK